MADSKAEESNVVTQDKSTSVVQSTIEVAKQDTRPSDDELLNLKILQRTFTRTPIAVGSVAFTILVTLLVIIGSNNIQAANLNCIFRFGESVRKYIWSEGIPQMIAAHGVQMTWVLATAALASQTFHVHNFQSTAWESAAIIGSIAVDSGALSDETFVKFMREAFLCLEWLKVMKYYISTSRCKSVSPKYLFEKFWNLSASEFTWLFMFQLATSDTWQDVWMFLICSKMHGAIWMEDFTSKMKIEYAKLKDDVQKWILWVGKFEVPSLIMQRR